MEILLVPIPSPVGMHTSPYFILTLIYTPTQERWEREKEHDIKISMDGKGRSIDNICIERFWRTIKYEEIYLNDYKSMHELRYSIKNYIDKYNSKRLHSAIDNKTPNEVYFQYINNLKFQNRALQIVS